jgi:hypothetical protein
MNRNDRTLLRVAFETEDFSLGLQPVVECIALPVATLGVELAGSTRDADLQIVAGRNRLTNDVRSFAALQQNVL